MKKPMPTLGVAGVYTGRVLKEGGFAEIHEVFDHFYPGIMTLSGAMMAETAKAEIARQHPELAELGECENWADYAQRSLAKFGPTIELDGPHGTGKPDMEGVGL